MKTTKSLDEFRCPACGKTYMLEKGKRHWCPCNPKAEFQMENVKGTKFIDSLISGALKGLKK